MSNNVLILEGHDQVGKTTIAHALAKQTGIPYFKIERNDKWWDPDINLKYTTEAISQFILKTNMSVILDRWMPSDYVYSKLFNRHIDYDRIFEIDKIFAEMNALLVICYKDDWAFKIDEKDKDLVGPHVYDKMTALYFEYAKKSKCKIVKMNTSDENLERQLALISQYMCYENKSL